MSANKTYTFHIEGMHCNACVLLTESELGDLKEVSKVAASLQKNTVTIEGDFGDKVPVEIATDLNPLLKPHGYTLSIEAQKQGIQWSDFAIALPLALAFIALFILLQKLHLINLAPNSTGSYGTAFVLGLIASVSTCMAVVGGLVLSLSANFAKSGHRIRPQVLFHISRLASFFIFGGVIGLVGSMFRLGITGTLVLGIIVGFVLLILGINLLDIFPWAKKFQLSMPAFIAKRAHGIKNINHTLTPVLAGIATFFLPCGFTQSMQIYTLTTGDFWVGGLTMLSFALGTVPVLALLSFSSHAILKQSQLGIFFKSAGLIVIFFAIFNLTNSFVAAGLIPPVFSF